MAASHGGGGGRLSSERRNRRLSRSHQGGAGFGRPVGSEPFGNRGRLLRLCNYSGQRYGRLRDGQDVEGSQKPRSKSPGQTLSRWRLSNRNGLREIVVHRRAAG